MSTANPPPPTNPATRSGPAAKQSLEQALHIARESKQRAEQLAKQLVDLERRLVERIASLENRCNELEMKNGSLELEIATVREQAAAHTDEPGLEDADELAEQFHKQNLREAARRHPRFHAVVSKTFKRVLGIAKLTGVILPDFVDVAPPSDASTEVPSLHMRLDWACDHLQAGNAAKLKQIAAYLKKHHDAMEPLSIPYVAALTDEDIADAVTMKYKVLRKAYLDRSNKKLYFDGGEEKLAEFERESDPESSDEDDDDDEDGEASDNAEAGSRKRKKRASKPKPTAQEIAKIRAGKEAAMADARKANASKLQGRRTAKAEYRAGGREALAAGHAYQDAKYDGCFVQQLQSDDEDPQDDSNNGCYETVANPWESEVSRAVKCWMTSSTRLVHRGKPVEIETLGNRVARPERSGTWLPVRKVAPFGHL